jgi:hypothetical protein
MQIRGIKITISVKFLLMCNLVCELIVPINP